MTTATILVQDALCQRGVLADNVAPSADQLVTGLRWLNRMLDSWANERQMIYAFTTEQFPMVAGTASYLSSAFVSAVGRENVVSIDSIYLRLSSIDYPVDLVDNQTYTSISYKSAQSIPTICYYDAASPVSTFFFYQTPNAAFTCFVDCYEKLSGTIAAATDLILPPGYEKAIIDNLCIYMNYGLPVTPQMRLDANESRNVLKRINYVPGTMNVGIGSGSSISNGFPYRGF